MTTPANNLSQIPGGGTSSLLGSPSAAIAVAPSAAAAASASTAVKSKKKATAKKATGPAATKAKAPKKPAAPRAKKPAASASSGGGKKTSGGGANSAANADATMVDAAIARLDLAKQRSIAAQRKSDPLWYRIEDVVFAQSMDDGRMYSNNILPEQITVVERALSNVGGLNRSDVTPQAMVCLLEQARRIAYELCADAHDYAFAAGRSDVSQADLLLAQELRSDVSPSSSVTTQLPKLNLTAQQVNRAPLPPIPSQCYTGVILPPKAHQLTARTFDVVSASVVAQKMTQPMPKSPATSAALAQNQQKQSFTSSSGGYGASRGRQIPISLKTNVSIFPVDTATNVSAVSNETAVAMSNITLPSMSASSDPTVAGAATSSIAHPLVTPGNAVLKDEIPTSSDIATTTQRSSTPTAMDLTSTQDSLMSADMDITTTLQSSLSTNAGVVSLSAGSTATAPSASTTVNLVLSTSDVAASVSLSQNQQNPPI